MVEREFRIYKSDADAISRCEPKTAIVCLNNPNHIIIRTAWLYGPGGNNFVEKVLRFAADRPVLKGVDDEIGSPTHTEDLAEATLALCRAGVTGTFHAVNEGACSRCEFVVEILRVAGLSSTVEPCKAAEFPSVAPRPKYSVLSNRKLQEACGHVMRRWDEALARYVRRRENSP